MEFKTHYVVMNHGRPLAVFEALDAAADWVRCTLMEVVTQNWDAPDSLTYPDSPSKAAMYIEKVCTGQAVKEVIAARRPGEHDMVRCDGCHDSRTAPIATIVELGPDDITFVLCEECGRDLANAVGFMCARDGGWSKEQGA